MTIKTPPLSQIERIARLRLLRTERIGPVTFHEIMQRFGSAVSAINHWSTIARKRRRASVTLLSSESAAHAELDDHFRCGSTLIAFDEDRFPCALAALDIPPPFVSAKGCLDLLQSPAVAVVGSRNASAIGLRIAKDLAGELSGSGVVVVSGLARGIDTAAHRGALKSGTIAVMAGGIDVIYPPENAQLHAQIVESGVVLSEMKPGQQLTAQHFPRRNRLVSGLSLGVVVVEATLNSGSLITARLAAEQGREVFAVPGSPLDPRARGTNSLLKQGATVAECAEDVLSALGANLASRDVVPQRHNERLAAASTQTELYVVQSRLLSILSPTPIELDELIRLVGGKPTDAATALLDLELAGLLTRHPGQRVSLSPDH